ncbi:MAG: phosphoribosyltransferase [Alphaproteobacteria bacterium]
MDPVIGPRGLADRETAGRLLAEKVAALELKDPVVLGLPRGGVPVAFEIAKRLNAPLDLVLVRKIGHPWQPELAIGAVVDGSEPQLVKNDEAMLGLPDAERILAEGEARELKEIERRRALYFGDRPRAAIAGKSAIVVDDGIATGATMRAALIATRRLGPAKLVLAVPVAPPEVIEALRSEVDDVVCLATPELFYAIGLWYQDFHQLTDKDVIALLAGR